jgi:hypothetical protein
MATFPAFFENIEMRLFSSALPKLGWSTAASGGDMAGCEADKVLDAPLRTIVGCLAEVLPIGPAQTALYWVAGLCILAAPFIYKYYLGILAQGAQPEGSIERQDYDKLRASLAGGNLAGRLYTKWLTAFLDGVERFFGDKGMANRTLFPRAFGLKTPAPLWTAPAFDRCLLLALIYPIATIFVIWAISGDVGPAEAALGLKRDLQFWRRGLAVAAIGFATFASWRSWLALNSKRGIGWVGVVVPAAAIVAGAAHRNLCVRNGPPTPWLGREDSNLHMAESKSVALPLGDAPMPFFPGWRPRLDHNSRRDAPLSFAQRLKSFDLRQVLGDLAGFHRVESSNGI